MGLFGKAIEQGISEGVKRSLPNALDSIIEKAVSHTFAHFEARIRELFNENASLKRKIADMERAALPTSPSLPPAEQSRPKVSKEERE